MVHRGLLLELTDCASSSDARYLEVAAVVRSTVWTVTQLLPRGGVELATEVLRVAEPWLARELAEDPDDTDLLGEVAELAPAAEALLRSGVGEAWSAACRVVAARRALALQTGSDDRKADRLHDLERFCACAGRAPGAPPEVVAWRSEVDDSAPPVDVRPPAEVLPVWLQRADSATWPVHEQELRVAHTAIGVRDGWSECTYQASAVDVTWTSRGPTSVEFVQVVCLFGVDGGHDIDSYTRAARSVIGFPTPAFATYVSDARLLSTEQVRAEAPVRAHRGRRGPGFFGAMARRRGSPADGALVRSARPKGLPRVGRHLVVPDGRPPGDARVHGGVQRSCPRRGNARSPSARRRRSRGGAAPLPRRPSPPPLPPSSVASMRASSARRALVVGAGVAVAGLLGLLTRC